MFIRLQEKTQVQNVSRDHRDLGNKYIKPYCFQLFAEKDELDDPRTPKLDEGTLLGEVYGYLILGKELERYNLDITAFIEDYDWAAVYNAVTALTEEGGYLHNKPAVNIFHIEEFKPNFEYMEEFINEFQDLLLQLINVRPEIITYFPDLYDSEDDNYDQKQELKEYKAGFRRCMSKAVDQIQSEFEPIPNFDIITAAAWRYVRGFRTPGDTVSDELRKRSFEMNACIAICFEESGKSGLMVYDWEDDID